MSTLNNKIALNLDMDVEVSLKAFIAPIAYTVGGFHKEWDALANLRVVEPEKQYSASVFQSFLPTKPVSVGECWQIEETGVMELLRQLNPNPNFDMHINAGDSLGLWGCLRAYNDEVVDIVFRIHAEFAITDGWFTPSQFTGHLVMDRIQKRVVFFQMCVPEGSRFDVNWQKDKNRPGFNDNPYYSTDSGICEQFELQTGTRIPNPEYTESITQETAAHKLIRCFYKSQRINWVSFDKALEMAAKMQKPIHAISMDGPLADESC